MFQSITILTNAFLCFRLQRIDLAVYSVTFHLQANTNLPYTLTDTTLYPGAIDTWRNSRWFPDSKCLSGFIMLAKAFTCNFQSKSNHQESQYMFTHSDLYNSCYLLKYERQRWFSDLNPLRGCLDSPLSSGDRTPQLAIVIFPFRAAKISHSWCSPQNSFHFQER